MHAKRIILGISGGIAAYKTPILVRDLLSRGAEVIPILTQSAARFVTRASLQAVSGQRVRDDLWDEEAEAAMGHIELARWADAVLVAPATAHLLARLAAGTADDLLTTVCLATGAPVFVAPAMNRQMWEHPAVQRNVARIENDGLRVLGPGTGDQACGETGPGRMLEPHELADALQAHWAEPTDAANPDGPLQGVRVLITAGPTREHIDPVRFISNHSSGKQGYAMARAARDAGAAVTLVSGPVHLDAPAGLRRVDVTTAREMKAAVEAELPDTDIFIGVAAVGDYRPAEPRSRKIKKAGTSASEITLPLKENPDILEAAVASGRPCVVGFAAETHDALPHAREKLARKGCDAIVVNDVSDATIGFDSNENAVVLIQPSGETVFPTQSKETLAAKLVDAIAALYHGTCGREEPSAGEREGLAPRMQEPSAGEREGLAPRTQEPSAGEREGPAPRMQEPSAGEREGPAPRMQEPSAGEREGPAPRMQEPSAGEREGLAPRMQEPSAGEREGLAPRMQEPSAGEREGPTPRMQEPSAGEREGPAPRMQEPSAGEREGPARQRSLA